MLDFVKNLVYNNKYKPRRKCMNKNTILYFHKEASKNLMDVFAICKEQEVSMFECSHLNTLFEIKNAVNPLCILLDNPENSDELGAIFEMFPDNYFFVIGTLPYNNSNIIYCDNTEELKTKLESFYKKIDNFAKSKEGIAECYKFITKQLEELNFSLSHIGTTYIKEIVMNKYVSPKQMLCSLSFTYNLIASKYECEKWTIERDIRFAIKMAKYKSETKNQNISIFKGNEPTVKQLTNYVLDKFLVTQM